MPFEVFEHTADLGVRVRSADLVGLFRDAARGLFSLVVENLDEVAAVDWVHVEVRGDDREYLLFDWLNELLYTFESRRLVLSEFRVRFLDGGLTADCSGEPLDLERHRAEHEVKAITYHGLRIVPEGEGWLAEFIVDI
jgi:SHS2 domain-containing protein